MTGQTFSPSGAYTIQDAAQQHGLLCDAVSAGADAIDLSGLTQCDTSGVQLLLAAVNDARAAQRPLLLIRPSEAVREIFQRYGLSPLLDDTSPGASR